MQCFVDQFARYYTPAVVAFAVLVVAVPPLLLGATFELWLYKALAIGIKAAFFILTHAGKTTLWMAVFADIGASLIVVFNGIRAVVAQMSQLR